MIAAFHHGTALRAGFSSVIIRKDKLNEASHQKLGSEFFVRHADFVRLHCHLSLSHSTEQANIIKMET